MSAASTSVVVVEIDTRKGPVKTVFESSIDNQSEQAKQFWKTLNLAPHIESSLYSKEIMQQIKPNMLKPMVIDHLRKPPEPNPKTEAFLKNVQVLNQIDEIMKIQNKVAKIESIKQMHKTKKEKTHKKNYVSRTALIKSESETKWISMLNEANDRSNNNEKIKEDEYEFDYDESHDVNEVRNLK